MAGLATPTVIERQQIMADEEKKDEGKEEGGKETDFMDELDAAADAHIEEVSERNPDADDKSGSDDKSDQDAGQEQDLEGKDEEGEQDEEGGDEDPAPDDALVERAVRAGISLADAKAVPTAAALERIVGRVETSASESKASKDDVDSKDEEKEEEDLLAKIPDLDPEEYPDELVAGFKGLKDLVVSQQKTIKDLQKGASAQGSWADAQIAALGKSFEGTFGTGNHADLPAGSQRDARDKLQRHIDFAMDDAKAGGKPIAKSDALKQALQNGFGDVIKKTKGQTAKAAAAARADKATNPPRRSDGTFASEKEDYGSESDREDDAVKEVAAMIAGNDA